MVTANMMKRYLKKVGITTTKLAERIKYPRSTLSSALNNGNAFLSPYIVADICECLNIKETIIVYDEHELHALTLEQIELLEAYLKLSDEAKASIMAIMRLLKTEI